mmetsp:Transcript_14482/g.36643  ORF Transcript_14482/g.36643 Transcript_14482/m.36643 type:complete len:222 (-) Transcript_14482:82-747(-)
MAQPKTRHDRVELPPPPYAWISWLVLLSYIACAVEGAIVFCTYPWHLALSLQNFDAGPSVFADVKSGQFHLCCIYIIELLMAFGPGWCAMSPGWTRFELLVHHAPYVSAVCLAFFGGHAERWTAPMTLVLLTPANEGMFIAQSLGAPDWLAKVRRLFGFCAICLLWACETWVLLRNSVSHWQMGRDSLPSAMADQVTWGGSYYHLMLLRMYVKRWKKTRTL